MAKKKTSKRKSTKRDPEIAERNKRLAIWGGTALLAGATFAVGAMGLDTIERVAAESVVRGTPEIQIAWPTLGDGTVWMPHTEQQNIYQSIARSIEGGRALSSEPLREAVLTLQASGWVDGVPEARWTSEGTIEVIARWRVPGAVVRVGQREVLIDWGRHVLPLDFAFGESNQPYFVNVSAPLPRTGQRWEGTDLSDGMGLLRMLREEGLLEQVAGFDLGTGSTSGMITIITTRGSRVVWGAGPGRERPGEQVSSVKIDRLQDIHESTGQLDGWFDMVDIRGAQIMGEKLSD